MTIHNSQLKANNKSINIPDLFGTLDYEVRRNKAEKPLETVEAMNQEIQQLFQNLQDDGADSAHLNDFWKIVRNGLDYEDSHNMHIDENGKHMNVVQALSSYVDYDKQLNPDKRKNNSYRFPRLSNLANVQDAYVVPVRDEDGKAVASGIGNHEKGMIAELSGDNLDAIERRNRIPSVFNVMSKYADPTMTDRDARLLYDHTVPYLTKANKLGINKGANYVEHPELIADSLAKYYAQATPQEQQQMDNLTFPRVNGVQQHVFYNHGHSVYENSVNDLVKNHYSLYVRGLSREMEDYNPVRNLSQQLEETMAHSDATKAGYSPISFNDLRKYRGTPDHVVHVGNKTYKAADNGTLNLVDRNGEHNVNEKLVNGSNYAMRDFEQTINHDDYYSFLQLNDKLYNDGKHNVAQLNRVKDYIETGIDNSKEQDAAKALSNLMLEDNAVYPKNVDLQNSLKDYLSRSNTAAFENLVNEGQLTGISAREVRQFESGVRYLQNNNLDYTLNVKNGALVASVPSNGASMQLTGQYAGSVAKSVDGTLLTYNTSTVAPIKFIFDPKYKDTPEIQDTYHYLVQNSIPFESFTTEHVAPDVKNIYDEVAVVKNKDGEIVKDKGGKTQYHAHNMLMFGDANGQLDNPNQVLAVGYDANRLNSLTMHTDAMDVACGLHSPVSGKLVQNESGSVFKSSFIGNGTEYRVTPQYGARMFGDDREFSNQAEAQAELTKALNDARKMAFNDEIKRVFNSNPRNRDLLYAAANVNRFVKDEDGVDKNVEENIQHTIEQLNPTQKAADQAVEVFSKLYAEDTVHGYSEERLNQALSQIVNEGGYDTQGAINLKRMYQLTAKYVDDHVGRTINYFDPQYVKSAITNTTTESLDYATKLMKAAGVKGPNLFTHGDQIALNRTIDNLVSFDESNAKTADELRNNQHDFEKETRDGFEAYLSRRYSGLELPISRADVLKQAGITVPENANVGALYQAAAERNPVVLSNARQTLVDQEFARVQALDKRFADDVDLTQVDQINTQEARELTAYRELKSILTDRASSVDNDLADQLDFIQGVLKDQGLDDVKVRIDGNGVVEWTGDLDKSFTKRDGSRYHFNVPARGEIGQLYGRDDQGVMQLRYASGDQRFKSAGNISYYSFDGSDRQERFRVKLPQDVQREVLRSELNTQLGRLNKIGGISVDNFAYEVAVTKYMQEHPGTTREDFDRERQDKNGDVYKSKQALKKGIAVDENGIPTSQSNKSIDHYEMFASPADRAAMISTLNGGGRSDVLTLSNASDVTAMSRLYSKEMYGQEINLRVLAHAHRPEASYRASNISQDLEKARVEEAKHKTLYDNNFAKAAGATSLSPDMPHSTYNSTEARLAGRQMVGESQVADATWADENATGSGANQGRQQTMQKPVLEKTEKRRDQRDLEQNALIKPADGEQYKLDTQDLHEVKGYDDPDGRSAIDTALTEMGLMSYLKYNAADRVNMFYKNMEQATNMGQANVAMMTFGGFTAEDSIVVSKKMAERMQIIGKNGEYRPLRAGDKLSDLHGNKGVISLVVDPDMPDDQAAAEGLTDEVKFFRDNPNVDMVGDPESVMSRANMGLAHEAMDHPVGKVNGMDVDIGTRTMLVTDKAADKDAHVAGTNEAGRSQGGLFQAALIEANCPELSKQLIGDRNNGFEKLSNLAEGLGYRLTPEGALINEETARNCDDDDHEIKTFDLEAEYEKAKTLFDAGKSLDDTYFSRAVQKNGSVVLKPNANKLLADAAQYDHVDIKMPQSGLNVQIGNNNTKVELKNERLPLKLFDPKTNKYSKTSDTISLVPVSDREERDLESGKASGLTKMYSKMINSAWNARYATDIAADGLKSASAKYQTKLPKNKTYEQAMHDEMNKNSVVRVGRYENSARMFGQNAQREIQRQVGGTGAEKDTSLQKAMRNHLLKPSEPNSGTLTAHADPRLSIDEVMIPQKLASQMHMQDGSVVLLQRDPIQKVGNIRTVNVRVNDDPNFQGIAMHPVIVKSFDGDFDGDKYGLTKIDLDSNNEALMNEVESLRPHNNLLDRLYTKEDANDDPKYGQGKYAREAGVMLNLSVEETAGMVAAVEKYQQTGENVLADNTLFNPEEYLAMRQQAIANDPEAAQLSEQDGLTQATVSDQTKKQAKDSNHSVAKALGAFTVADYVERKVKAKAQSIEKMPIEQRQRQADNLSKSIQQLEHANFGAIHLNCANEGATRNSLVRMVETGAKGKMDKVENDMHYYHGFDDQPRGEHSVLLYNYDKDGHQLRPLNEREAPKMTEHRLYQDETHKAMRIKTDFTAIAGAIEQRMLASAMSVSPRECSEIAAGFYQDLLQAKHDPNDAVKRVKHTQDLGKLLSGRNPKTNYPYRDLNDFKNDMKELVIGTVHCKVGGTVIDQMCDKMFDSEKGRSISIEQAFKGDQTAYGQFMFGHGTKTLTELMKATEAEIPEGRKKSLGAYKTFVKERIGEKAIKEGNRAAEITINNMIPSDFQPKEEAIEQAHQMHEVRTNEAVHAADEQRENVEEDTMGISHEHDHDMPSMSEE